MAVPREIFDETKRAELATRLEAIIRRTGPEHLNGTNDFENLAETVAKIAPDLKSPIALRNFQWFLKIYRETEVRNRPRDPALSESDVECEIQQEVESELSLH